MLKQNRSRSLRKFVYRSLTIRLTVAGVIIALAFGALTFTAQYKDISESVVIDALNQLDLILYHSRQIASRYGIDPKKAFEQVLDQGLPVQYRQPYGMFIYALMYNSSGEIKGEFQSKSATEISQVRDMVQSATRRFPETKQTWREIVRIDKIPHIHFVTAVTGVNNNVLGYADIVFRVFPETVMALRKTTLKTVLYVLLIILATTLMLYPVILTLTRQLARYSETLLDSNLETLSVLGSAIAKRDSDTDAHNYRVTIYSVRMAEAMGLDKGETQHLIKGAFLHDVGKIGIRDDILLKPGPLDAEEIKIMKTHVNHGGDIVQRSKWLQDAEDVVTGHHEKFGGAGYPNGLKGHEIPLAARIFALVDVFDALTSKRPYKEPLSFEESMQILEQGRGNHFDPKLVDAFSTIAEPLFREFGGREDDKLKETLRDIVHQYFSAGLETLTY